MKKRKLFWMFMCTICVHLFSLHVYAQGQKISGKVQSADEKPIEGVTITIEGSTVSAVTAADGTFSLVAQSGNFKIMDNPRTFQARHYLWPIPQAEMDVNKHPDFTQNSGY